MFDSHCQHHSAVPTAARGLGSVGGGGSLGTPERAMSGAQGIDPREKMRAGFAVVAVVLVAAVVVVTTPN